jgi:hypothetical protein
LYWVIRIVTISVPTILFTLFSTSWTVTMNATTLYVGPPESEGSSLTMSPGCSFWRASFPR